MTLGTLLYILGRILTIIIVYATATIITMMIGYAVFRGVQRDTESN